MSNLAGYVPGVSQSQAASDRPLSRADVPQTPKQLRDMLETKRTMIKVIRSASDDDYFTRNEKNYLNQLEAIETRLKGLRLDREQGPQRIAALEADIAAIEGKLKEIENASIIKQAEALLAQLAELGIDPALL